MERADVILVGAGLANCLLALRLSQARPRLSILLVERGPSLAGNHTWSFHEADMEPATLEWLAPLTTRWQGYDVAFRSRRRTLDGGYRSLTSDRLRATIQQLPGIRVRTRSDVGAVAPEQVVLANGDILAACCVVDGTGWARPPGIAVAYQRFVGLDLTLDRPHGLSRPMIMDATVAQRDGFSFFYLLPWDETRVLVEETVYADTPDRNPIAARAAIQAYTVARGWTIRSVEREEEGTLPVVLEGGFDDLAAAWTPGVPTVGVKAGLFHGTTSYSLPFAARLAHEIAALPDLASGAVARLTEERARRVWERQGFFRMLNRMLFRAGAADRRVQVFERFYGLGAGLIERFYADRLTSFDRIRLLVGKPPVPFFSALRSLPARKVGPA